MTVLGGEQLPRGPQRREGSTAHLAWVTTPPPAIATYRGDDPAGLPRTSQRPIELVEVGVAHPSAARFVLEQALKELPDTQHGRSHCRRRLRFGGIEWGVEKHETGWELIWKGHVTNVTVYGGYVTQPPP